MSPSARSADDVSAHSSGMGGPLVDATQSSRLAVSVARRYDRPMVADLPPELASLPRWGFADPGLLRDELTALALAGTKTTTAALLVELELDGEAVPEPGAREVMIDSADRPVAVVETIECPVKRLADVDDRHAIDEGEGYANAAEFRVAHEDYWNAYIDDLRRRLGDPSFSLTDDTLIACQRFGVIATIDPDTGSVTWREPASVAG